MLATKSNSYTFQKDGVWYFPVEFLLIYVGITELVGSPTR